MIKNIFFYGLLAIATLFLACQDKKDEPKVKKDNEINEIEVEFKEKPNNNAIKKYGLDNYHILGYFTFDKDSLVTNIDSTKTNRKYKYNTSCFRSRISYFAEWGVQKDLEEPKSRR